MEDHIMTKTLAITNLTFDFLAKEEGAIISIPQVFRYYILHLECKSPSHLIRNYLWARTVDPFLFICPQFQLLFWPIHLQKKNPPQLLQLKEILPTFIAHGEISCPSAQGAHKRAKNSAGSSTAATTSGRGDFWKPINSQVAEKRRNYLVGFLKGALFLASVFGKPYLICKVLLLTLHFWLSNILRHLQIISKPFFFHSGCPERWGWGPEDVPFVTLDIAKKVIQKKEFLWKRETLSPFPKVKTSQASNWPVRLILALVTGREKW